MNDNLQSRSAFNFTLCLLLAAAVSIFYSAVKFGGGVFLGQSHLIVSVISVACLICASFMINQINNVPVQLAGFVIIPAILGVFSARWMVNVDHTALMQAGLVTVLCIGVTMLASVLFPNLFIRAIGVLFIALIAVIVTSIISMLFFHTYLSFLDYVSVVIFMGFLGYDIVESREVPPNFSYAIAIAGKAFVDILNIFTSVLMTED
ncbi:Bax inhibitor-1 family protein [Photobacterium damselae]|uniref:Bax inhibitor-1 family protein n=1 Tax=Photobacterium damselae TaxID=38293 RepID=UPI001F34729D|nr:Bax inhibitor-1 family protein [Photobacterium damselae]UKA04488.1 Bax inhibitor-1 family protein [Photobacterium damselae subsp. damselae]